MYRPSLSLARADSASFHGRGSHPRFSPLCRPSLSPFPVPLCSLRPTGSWARTTSHGGFLLPAGTMGIPRLARVTAVTRSSIGRGSTELHMPEWMEAAELRAQALGGEKARRGCRHPARAPHKDDGGWATGAGIDMAAAAGKRKVRRWEEGKMNAPTHPSPEKEPFRRPM